MFYDYYDRYESIQNQIIQMSHTKIPTAANIKNAFKFNNQNSLMAILDKKRQQKSKEKIKSKFIDLLQNGEQNQTKAAALINFRSLKNTQKSNKEAIHNKLKPKPSLIQPLNGHKSQRNNQNMPLAHKQNLMEVVPQRSVSRKKRQQDTSNNKISKISRVTINNYDLDDFGCNQQLVYKTQPKTQKKLVSQGLADKKVSDRSLKHPKKTITNNLVDLQQQLVEFDSRCLEINSNTQTESLSFLDGRNVCYMIDSQYIERRQKNFNWTMRAILMDWMMHISYEFKLKRETLHIALTLVDNFFQATTNLSKADFQLAGAAVLFIATKLQEFEPLSSKQFAKSTKDRYSSQQIKIMQTKICKVLKYNLNPPTINMWANRIMQQWDLFLEGTTILQQPFFQNHQPLFFKKIDEDSYKNYRQMMQILDCAILDIQTVQYKPKMLVCSLLYLILGKQFNEFSKKKIVNQFPRTSLFFLEENDFNSMFRYFLQQTFGLQMYQLLPSVQYLSTYFLLSLSYQRPCLRSEQQFEDMHLQEYCSYQTYNPNMLAAIRKRYRGIYE